MNGQMKSFRPVGIAWLYFITDIPHKRIDYRGLVVNARKKECHVSNLSDEEKNRFIVDADMDYVREKAIKI